MWAVELNYIIITPQGSVLAYMRSGNLTKKLLASDLLRPAVILWQTVECEVVHEAER